MASGFTKSEFDEEYFRQVSVFIASYLARLNDYPGTPFSHRLMFV